MIPPAWLHEPGAKDLLVSHLGDRLVVLPAAGAVRLVRPQPPASAEGRKPGVAPVLSLPAVGKESVKMVRVDGETGFLIDAGGRPAVVMPGALAAMTGALDVQAATGMVITHLHEDHVGSLAELVLSNRIRPENLHFPDAFLRNPNAPSSLFAQLMNRLRSDPRAAAFGHGRSAAYGVIPTPASGDWWRTELRAGDLTIELYGISAAFRALAAKRGRGEAQERHSCPVASGAAA